MVKMLMFAIKRFVALVFYKPVHNLVIDFSWSETEQIWKPVNNQSEEQKNCLQ